MLIITFISLLLFCNCKNTERNSNLIRLDQNYCDLFDKSQKDLVFESVIKFQNQSYFVDTYFDESVNIIFDNVLHFQLNQKKEVLFSDANGKIRFVGLNSDYDRHMSNLLDSNYKSNNSLTIHIFYEDNVEYNQKIKFLKPILEYNKNKKDSLSYVLYNNYFTNLTNYEKEIIKNKIKVLLYFTSCKLEPPRP